MSENTFEVSDVSFQKDVLDSDTPVLVDFWADWCGPCKMIAPAVEEIAKKYNGKLRVAKMDVDANGNTPGNYDIQGIPTLLLFKGGKVVSRMVGFRPQASLEKDITPHLDLVKA